MLTLSGIGKPLALYELVYEWKLCIHEELPRPRRRHPRRAALPRFRRSRVSRRRRGPRRLPLPHSLEMQHLASLVGIRNLPEEAHHWGGVGG